MRSLPSLVCVAIVLGLSSFGPGCATELDNPGAFANPTAGSTGTSGAAGNAGAGGASGGTGGSAGVSGAAGTSGAGSGGNAAVCDAPTTIFALASESGGCMGPACHSTGAIGPDLQAADIPGRLRDVQGIFCSTGKFIDSAAPANSLLITKILASNACLQRMPAALPPLDDADIQCVTDWVNSVASP